mmetsp:Transcript_8821/g.16362  ORF Transcript_8821/g.16362 Transcript_8821/m.16362 type:complete len:307 (-) Transcript_8821:680-1600(-)
MLLHRLVLVLLQILLLSLLLKQLLRGFRQLLPRLRLLGHVLLNPQLAGCKLLLHAIDLSNSRVHFFQSFPGLSLLVRQVQLHFVDLRLLILANLLLLCKLSTHNLILFPRADQRVLRLLLLLNQLCIAGSHLLNLVLQPFQNEVGFLLTLLCTALSTILHLDFQRHPTTTILCSSTLLGLLGFQHPVLLLNFLVLALLGLQVCCRLVQARRDGIALHTLYFELLLQLHQLGLQTLHLLIVGGLVAIREEIEIHWQRGLNFAALRCLATNMLLTLIVCCPIVPPARGRRCRRSSSLSSLFLILKLLL